MTEYTEIPTNQWPEIFAIDGLKTIVPEIEYPDTAVVTITGDRSTFKSTIGVNFLLKGVIEGENVLQISFSDQPKVKFRNRVSNDISKLLTKKINLLERNLLRSEKEIIQLNITVNEIRKLLENYRKKHEIKDRIKRTTLRLELLDKRKALKCRLINKNHKEIKLLITKYKEIHKKKYYYKRAAKQLKDLKNPFGLNSFFTTNSKKRIQDSFNIKNKNLDINQYNLNLYLGAKPTLTEISFKSGMLLPEEFIHVILKIIKKFEKDGKKITRIVLDDVSLIDISYPFLRKSETASNLFLPLFVHLIRNEQIKLVMIGTTEETEESKESVERATALADTVIRCESVDVFGDQNVIIKGEGIRSHTNHSSARVETVPGVIRKSDENTIKTFSIDHDFLRGLVGFDTGKIRRPGLEFQLFEANNEIQKAYNMELKKLSTMAIGSKKDVKILKFNDDHSEAFHSALDVLNEKPVDKTIIFTFDEFFLTDEKQVKRNLVNLKEEYFETLAAASEAKEENEKNKLHKGKPDNWVVENYLPSIKQDLFFKDDTYGVPYYSNVLLLAYDSDGRDDLNLQSWSNISGYFNEHKNEKQAKPFNHFYLNKEARETLSCLLLDGLFAEYINSQVKKDESNDPIRISLLNSVKKTKNINLLLDYIKENGGKSFPEISAIKKICSEVHDAFSKIDNKDECDCTGKEKQEKCDDKSEKKKKKKKKEEKLTKFMAVVWYSELRDLIKQEKIETKNLKIAALPGGGFRGDWYMGIKKGSVSINLGVDTLKKICNQPEDFKRFNRGVGLPTYETVFNNETFKAWESAPANHHLKKIYDIHEKAVARSWIEGYPEFRSILYSAFEEIISSEDSEIRMILSSLKSQIELFKTNA